MSAEIIKYDGNNLEHSSLVHTDRHFNNLQDLSGTLDDIGELIAYLRDLSRQLVPLVDSAVPVMDNLNDVIENLPKKLERFLEDNPAILFAGVFGTLFIGTYIGTGIFRNILEIKKNLKK